MLNLMILLNNWNLFEGHMLKFKIIVFLLVFFISLFSFRLFRFYVVNHISNVVLEDTYSLPFEFSRVKIVLMKNDVMEEIISNDHGEIIERKWDKFVLSGNRPFRDGININGSGEFLISKNEPDIGKILLKFKQQVSLTRTEINSNVKLIEPIGHIKEIETTMQVIEKEKETLFKIRTYIKYERLIPRSMIETVDKKVKESASKMLRTNREVVTKIVEENVGEKFSLPILKKKLSIRLPNNSY